MAHIVDKLARNLAENLILLRQNNGLSQIQLAKRAQIPRSTLTYMESGVSNPSLGNLAKVAQALQVSLEELISPPPQQGKLWKADELPIQKKSKNTVTIAKLLPDPIPGMEIDKFHLQPGSRFKGSPHTQGTREYLYCIKGRLKVYVQRGQYVLEQGDLFSFAGDEPHAYENPSFQKTATGFSVVALASRWL